MHHEFGEWIRNHVLSTRRDRHGILTIVVSGWAIVNPIFSCGCLLTPMLAFMLAVGTGMQVYRKGYNGFFYGLLYVVVCMSAVIAGSFLAIVIAVTLDPQLAKDDIGGAGGFGGSLGMAFGVILMGLVTRLLPDARPSRPKAFA
jgi:hypothetical protein